VERLHRNLLYRQLRHDRQLRQEILTQVRVSECSLMRVQSWFAAFYGAKSITHVLRNVLLLYLGTVNTQRQF